MKSCYSCINEESICKEKMSFECHENNYIHYKPMNTKNRIFFTIKGEPVAKARARVFRNKYSGKVMAYTPKKTVNAENTFRIQSLPFKPKEPIQTPIWLVIRVFRTIPVSFNAIKRGLAESKELLPIIKPDLDNYVKTVLDSMNGVFYRDDAQIVSITASKYYSNNPRLEIEVQY